MKNNATLHLAAGLVLAMTLTACGGKSQDAAPAASAASGAPATIVMPTDPKLATLYGQTCKACHGNPGNPAPQAGDKAAWGPRAAQGMPVLLDHAIKGYKGMPPLGTCMDCGEPEFTALIKFMTGETP